MIEINLIDEAGVLSPDDFKKLKCFIIDNCLCTSEHTARLQHAKIRNDGASQYYGYWTAKYTHVGADVKDVIAVIVLNSYYLRLLKI